MEREFIKWLTKLGVDEGSQVVLGIGDDAAVLDQGAFADPDRSGVIVTTDAISDGTHFMLGDQPLELVGRKALAVNLSDLAAMAARPVAATVSLSIPRGFGLDQAKQLFAGIERLSQQFQVPVVGGDTNVFDGPLTICVTAIGTPMVWPVWKMSGAKSGDVILVSGHLGGSILGRHLTFEPRVELAEALAAKYTVNSATDISDSLSLDLNALTTASGVGAVLNREQIPIANAAKILAADSGKSPIEHALTDGEDFELLITVTPEVADRLLSDHQVPGKMTRIGKITDTPGLWSEDDGHLTPVSVSGYTHD